MFGLDRKKEKERRASSTSRNFAMQERGESLSSSTGKEGRGKEKDPTF